jgi:hypothetical protein
VIAVLVFVDLLRKRGRPLTHLDRRLTTGGSLLLGSYLCALKLAHPGNLSPGYDRNGGTPFLSGPPFP